MMGMYKDTEQHCYHHHLCRRFLLDVVCMYNVFYTSSTIAGWVTREMIHNLDKIIVVEHIKQFCRD
jgi:23S rRNA maturation-related 3'-5' exoribonuclease YhaM